MEVYECLQKLFLNHKKLLSLSRNDDDDTKENNFPYGVFYLAQNIGFHVEQFFSVSVLSL